MWIYPMWIFSMQYIVSCSFGKDSLAMLLKLIELHKPIDDVVFFDTGMEFNAIYHVIRQFKDNHPDIKLTILSSKKQFTYLMEDHVINHRDGTTSQGYKWCGNACRWFTSQKTITISRYLKDNYTEYKQYVGIAADEIARIERNSDSILPLVELGMTERDCLEYCHSQGYYWYENQYELYDYLDRVSCWCCRNKNLKELENIYRYFKPYWYALCDLESRFGMCMKSKPLKELEKRWKTHDKLFD